MKHKAPLGFCAYCKRWNDWQHAEPADCTNTHGHDYVYDQDAINRRLRDLAWTRFVEEAS